ncbi:MAG: NosD domain-containing protein [Candidatus Heimdallarchaeaceae archaeon]
MRKSFRTIFFILLLFAVFLSQSEVRSLETNDTDTIPEIANNLTSYVEHDPIIINSNDDFITYGFEGNGTVEAPYVIENYSITANSEYGIKICCSDKIYTIQNCYINLENDSTTYAIYLQDSPEYCSVINNTCEDNDFGLYLKHCTTMQINGNLLTGNIKGLYAFNSNLLVVSYNNCTDSNQVGLEFYDCMWIDLMSNMIFKNRQTGVKFNDVHESIIWLNFFIENYAHAVYLTSNTFDNDVYLNTFIDNAQIYDAQAYDSGDNFWYNTIELTGNLWSDLGFDCYYELDGAAGAYDYYPTNKEGDCTIYTLPTSSTEPTTVSFSLDIALIILISAVTITYQKQRKKKREN